MNVFELLLAALTLPLPPAEQLRHVRGTEPWIAALIDDGAARSPTLASLLASLDDSDVIVYVDSQVVRERLAGYLVHQVIVRGRFRYVWIVVSRSGNAHLIGVIAHELQHALEVAQAPDVGRTERVDKLFERIGFRWGCVRSCYETIDAMNVERLVREELRASPSTRSTR